MKGKPAKTTTFEAYYDATGEQDYGTSTLLIRRELRPCPHLSAGGSTDLSQDIDLARVREPSAGGYRP